MLHWCRNTSSDLVPPPPVGEQSIVVSVSVCLSVCPKAYLRNYTSNLYQIWEVYTASYSWIRVCSEHAHSGCVFCRDHSVVYVIVHTVSCYLAQMGSRPVTFLWLWPATEHIVDTCPLTKFEDGPNLLHRADDGAVIWLDSTLNHHHITSSRRMQAYWRLYPMNNLMYIKSSSKS